MPVVMENTESTVPHVSIPTTSQSNSIAGGRALCVGAPRSRPYYFPTRCLPRSDHSACGRPRLYHAEIQARLLVLACQKPSEVDPTRTGQTHRSINDLAQFVADHPELGLGSPSKSTVGVILKRHQVRLKRL